MPSPEQHNYPIVSSATGKGTPSYALSAVRLALCRHQGNSVLMDILRAYHVFPQKSFP